MLVNRYVRIFQFVIVLIFIYFHNRVIIQYDATKKVNIPDSINSGQLVRDLSRELRRLEKLLVPPSPNSSINSNKKKKKKIKQPVNRFYLI